MRQTSAERKRTRVLVGVGDLGHKRTEYKPTADNKMWQQVQQEGILAREH